MVIITRFSFLTCASIDLISPAIYLKEFVLTIIFKDRITNEKLSDDVAENML